MRIWKHWIKDALCASEPLDFDPILAVKTPVNQNTLLLYSRVLIEMCTECDHLRVWFRINDIVIGGVLPVGGH